MDFIFATNVITGKSSIWTRGVFKPWFWPGATLVVLESDITKQRPYVFCLCSWLGYERATSELLYRLLFNKNIATDFQSKLCNRPHEDSWTTVCCITEPLQAKITMSVCFKNSLMGIRGPINVSGLWAQGCRAIKHSSVTSSKRHREQGEKKVHWDNSI